MNLITDVLTVSKLRSTIFTSFKDLITNSKALRVTSKEGNLIVIPEAEFNGMKETLYLMSSPGNAQRLQDAVDAANRGEFAVTFNSIEEFDEYTEKRLKENGL